MSYNSCKLWNVSSWKVMWCVCFFPNPFTALLGPVHRWGMVLMDGFLFSFHTSASISFPSQTPTATTFSLSLILITAEQFSLSLIFQLISSPPPPWYLHLPLNSLNGFRRLRWPAELYCRHIIYIKKVTCSQVNPLSDVFSPVVQQEYWLAALC